MFCERLGSSPSLAYQRHPTPLPWAPDENTPGPSVQYSGCRLAKNKQRASPMASSTNSFSPLADLQGNCPSLSHSISTTTRHPSCSLSPRRVALQSPEDSGTSDYRSQMPASHCSSCCLFQAGKSKPHLHCLQWIKTEIHRLYLL